MKTILPSALQSSTAKVSRTSSFHNVAHNFDSYNYLFKNLVNEDVEKNFVPIMLIFNSNDFSEVIHSDPVKGEGRRVSSWPLGVDSLAIMRSYNGRGSGGGPPRNQEAEPL